MRVDAFNPDKNPTGPPSPGSRTQFRMNAILARAARKYIFTYALERFAKATNYFHIFTYIHKPNNEKLCIYTCLPVLCKVCGYVSQSVQILPQLGPVYGSYAASMSYVAIHACRYCAKFAQVFFANVSYLATVGPCIWLIRSQHGMYLLKIGYVLC